MKIRNRLKRKKKSIPKTLKICPSVCLAGGGGGRLERAPRDVDGAEQAGEGLPGGGEGTLAADSLAHPRGSGGRAQPRRQGDSPAHHTRHGKS
eukprot:639999-Prorocentrum_minimum.AAC.2